MLASTLLRSAGRLVWSAVVEFQNNKGSLMAAGLAYFMLISASPLFVVAIAFAGLILGREEAQAVLLGRVGDVIGADAAENVASQLREVGFSSGRLVASLIATAVLFYGATRAFAALQQSLDAIWGVPVSTSIRRGLLQVVRSRLLAFVMVLALGLVMLATMMLETIGGTAEKLLERYTMIHPDLGSGTMRLASIALRGTCLAAVYKGLPACRVAWRDVWLAGLVTALMLSFGHTLIGWYVAHSGLKSAYGAAGSVIVLLFSFYYAAFIVLLGAQFSKVLATNRR